MQLIDTYIVKISSSLNAERIYTAFYKGRSDQWHISSPCRLMSPVKQFIRTGLIAMSYPL